MSKHGYNSRHSGTRGFSRYVKDRPNGIQRREPITKDGKKEGFRCAGQESVDADSKASRKTTLHSQGSCCTLNTDFGRATSSLASWEEDEHDKETSRRVEALLEELDAALYESVPLPNKKLQEECEEWASMFPYHRLVGKQIATPLREKGYRFHTLPQQRDVRKFRPSTAIPKELAVTGRRITPSSLPHCVQDTTDVEEVLAQDGLYEELVAVDESEMGSSAKQTPGIVTDQVRSVQEPGMSEIMDALFESVWPDVEQALGRRRMEAVATNMSGYEGSSSSHSRARDTLSRSASGRFGTAVTNTPVSMRKRVPSTAVSVHSTTSSTRRAVSSSLSRTAPSTVIKSNVGGTGTPVARSRRLTKLPPIDSVATPRLPNVPLSKSQRNRDTMIGGLPLVNEESDKSPTSSGITSGNAGSATGAPTSLSKGPMTTKPRTPADSTRNFQPPKTAMMKRDQRDNGNSYCQTEVIDDQARSFKNIIETHSQYQAVIPR